MSAKIDDTVYRVQVTKDYLVFASAHFITFAGHRCESLHGHNYRVGVALEGTLDPESWYVFDFVALKRLMKKLCDEIDHRVLLPLENPRLTIGEQGESVTVAYDQRPRYVFPREDCALLPLPNTTVEMLAQYLAKRVKTELGPAAARLSTIEIEVEENFGQSAIYREMVSRSPDLRTGIGAG
jgi:6-pyruvoyltetrahydropterin/6-carboxytetrahydropterin synthase